LRTGRRQDRRNPTSKLTSAVDNRQPKGRGLTVLTKLTMISPFILFMGWKKEEISSRELRKHEE